MPPEPTSNRPDPRRRPRRFRPRLDPLEPRALLATLTVTAATDSGPGSLRQAIAAAAPGDTVTFAPALAGRKITLTSGPLSVTKSLKIVGPTGPALTNISGGGRGGVFVIQPATLSQTTPPINVSIVGLEVADGASGNGAIDATQANLTLADDAVINNQYRAGGVTGPGFNAGGVVVHAGYYGTDPFKVVAGSLAVYGTTFRGNSGGALNVQDTPAIIVTSAFTDNGDNYGGSAIVARSTYSTTATLTVIGSRFTGNRTDSLSYGFGGAMSVGMPATVTDSWFGGNVSISDEAGFGGAIFDYGSPLTIRGSTFVANRAEGGGQYASASGGAVAVDPGSFLTIDGSTFLGNVAQSFSDAEGGAVRYQGGVDRSTGRPIGSTITNSTFSGNQAVGLPSASQINAASTQGGAVIASSTGPVTIANVDFLGNQALASSGGLNGVGGFSDGGGLFAEAPLTLSNSLFSGNLAQGGSGSLHTFVAGSPFGGGGPASGGGLATLSGGASTITNTQFVANSAIGGAGTGASAPGGDAGGGGVALFATYPLSLTDVSAIGNSAVGGAGGPAGTAAGSQGGAGGTAQGGGVNSDQPNTTITGGRFASNTARGGDSPAGVAGAALGGGIYSSSDPGSPPTPIFSLTLVGAVVSSNTASGGSGLSGGAGQGGGVYVAGIVSIANDAVSNNLAQGGPAAQGLGGGVYEAPAIKSTVDKASRIAGNRASTSGNDLYSA